MKKIFYFLASAIVALGAMACQNEVDENINPNETKEISFKVSFDESTRIAMGELTGGKLPFEFDGKGLKGGPDSLYVGYSTYNGEGYDTKRAFLVNSEEKPYEFVADAKNQAILQELVGEENIYVVNRNNETADPANGANGLLFKSEVFDLVAGENEVSLSLACSAFYFTVPAGNEASLTIKGEYTTQNHTFGEGTHIVGYKSDYPAVTISYSINGVTVKEASLTLTNKVYNLGTLNYEFTTINTKEQLIAFAEHVNAGNNYKGKTVKLGQSIDLEGEILAPIGNSKANAFRGNFDGQGNTISNFTVEHAEVAGLFGMLAGGSIKNLNVNKATIYGNSYAGGIVAWVQATSYQGWQGAADAVVDNCNVTYTEITSTVINNDNAAKVGGIAGYVVYGTISNSTVADTNITAYRDMGGIAGMANFASSNGKGAVISGNTVGENVTITVDNSTNYNNYTTADQYNVASIVGRISTGAIVENNTGEATIVMPKTAVEKLNEQIAAGGTITLTEDIVAGENEKITVPAGKTVTLDLNGHTISQEKVCTASHELICNNGDLTITGEGTISFKDNSEGDPTFGWGSYTIRNTGNLTIENGTIEHLTELNNGSVVHMYCAVFSYSGNVVIKGGTFKSVDYRSVRAWSGSLTINGGNFEGQIWIQPTKANFDLNITGGTFAPRGVDGSSVFVENATHTVDVEITGGTFTTKLGASKAVKGWVKGGQFKVDPSAYVAENLLALKNYKTENMYDVVAVTESANWHMVGDHIANSWQVETKNTPMYEINGTDWLVVGNIKLEANKSFKLINGTTWDNAAGSPSSDATADDIDTWFHAGTGNIKVANEGTYNIYYDTKNQVVIVANIESAIPELTFKTYYLNTGGTGLWNQAGAWFGAHLWTGSAARDYKMVESGEANIFKIEVPIGFSNAIFLRMGKDATDFSNMWNSGDNGYWNKTGDLTINTNNCYTITSWSSGKWSVK